MEITFAGRPFAARCGFTATSIDRLGDILLQMEETFATTSYSLAFVAAEASCEVSLSLVEFSAVKGQFEALVLPTAFRHFDNCSMNLFGFINY